MSSVTLLPTNLPSPPRTLGGPGLALWNKVLTDYHISDVGGLELLAEAAAGLDRAEELAAAVARDGATFQTKSGPKVHPAVRAELAARAFVVRTLARLGIATEAIRPMGRPPVGGWSGR